VEWEPSERTLSLGIGPFGGTLHWYITDANHHLVDRSPAQGSADLLAAVGTGTDALEFVDGWLVSRKLVHPPGASGALLTRERTEEEIEKGEYPALVFTTGIRIGPLRSILNTLALGLVAVSVVVWLAALVLARRVCRRALRPVTEMAEAARDMKANDVEARLPPPNSRGELEDLHLAISGLLDRLRSALGRERQFTAEASHQLRTPLATILGQVEVALRRPRDAKEYARVLEIVRQNALNLSQSVEALLFHGRSEADAPPPTLEPIELGEWTQQFLSAYETHARRADLSFELDRNDPIMVEAHVPLLKEMLANLIDNALKYSAPGTPIVVRVLSESNRAKVIVEDRGPGIAAGDLPHIFEPFFRSRNAEVGGIPGTGLGLAVVARIASAFQGRVEVKNRPQGGTQFTVVLPLRVDKEEFISASSRH
jgi:signal transduction histidine kinase